MARRAWTAPNHEPSRFTDWFDGLPQYDKAEFRALFGAHPAARTIVSSLPHFSPYLWDLASADTGRLRAILQADPDAQLATLVAALAAQGRRDAQRKPR